MLKTSRILALVGPTASGKTSLSLLLAEILNGEIISADSRQIYRYLDIGTAKPDLTDRKRIRHHFVDLLEPAEEYSAGQYGQEARKVVRQVLDRGKVPILVGGSGLYVKSALDGLFGGPGKDPEVRRRLEERFHRDGIQTLMEDLERVDPVTLERMKEITPRRVIRALEVYSISGVPLSEFHAREEQAPEFESLQFGLEWDRKVLYERINERVDRMISMGLVQEVRDLQLRGFSRQLNSLNTVGYNEVFDYLEGKTDRESMTDLIKRNSRRFGKRQLTWFKTDNRIHWISMTKGLDLFSVAQRISELYRRGQVER